MEFICNSAVRTGWRCLSERVDTLLPMLLRGMVRGQKEQTYVSQN